MKNIVILYPHGLGDCILLTPVLKLLKRNNYDITLVIQKRFKSSEIFKNCPYVNRMLYCRDVWNDFPSYEKGVKELTREFEKYKTNEFVFLHTKGGHKTLVSLQQLSLKYTDYDLHTEVFISEEDRKIAQKYMPDKPYGFIQTNTGVHTKDLPEYYGINWLSKHCKLSNFVEIGVDFKYDEININAQFYLMSQAAGICVPDSVFYHAACAMNKKIDLAYFQRGESVYNRVCPLHEVNQNIVYKLETL